MIVEAVGIAVHSVDADRQKYLEDAMVTAVKQAQAEGITDPDVIRARIHAVRNT
jgi:hypothetical protein